MRVRCTAVLGLVLVTALSPLSPWMAMASAIRAAEVAAVAGDAPPVAAAAPGVGDARPGVGELLNASRIGHPAPRAFALTVSPAAVLPPAPAAVASLPSSPPAPVARREHPPRPPRGPPV